MISLSSCTVSIATHQVPLPLLLSAVIVQPVHPPPPLVHYHCCCHQLVEQYQYKVARCWRLYVQDRCCQVYTCCLVVTRCLLAMLIGCVPVGRESETRWPSHWLYIWQYCLYSAQCLLSIMPSPQAIATRWTETPP